MKAPSLRTGLLALVAATLAFVPATSLAQAPGRDRQDQQDRGPRGNFDPAQFQQRLMDNLRERLGVTDDAEWKIISERIQKVMEARRTTGFGMGAGLRFGGPPGRAGADNAPGGRRGFGAAALPEAEALQRAIESKASKEELKAAMAKYREAREANQAKLRQAQEDLRKVLTLEQEAIALQMGLVD